MKQRLSEEKPSSRSISAINNNVPTTPSPQSSPDGYGNITVITSQTIVQLSQCRVISRPSRILLQTRQRFASIIYTLCFVARTTRNFIRITIELVAWAALSFIYICMQMVCKRLSNHDPHEVRLLEFREVIKWRVKSGDKIENRYALNMAMAFRGGER